MSVAQQATCLCSYGSFACGNVHKCNLLVQAASKSQDPLRVLADTLRSKGGVEWRSAVMADQRVEFIRGKDLAAHFRAHPEQMQNYVSKGAPARSFSCFLFTTCSRHFPVLCDAGAALRIDQQIKELGELMIRRRLFIKADRMFKKPKPGKKRLVKWPHKLVPLYEDKARSPIPALCPSTWAGLHIVQTFYHLPQSSCVHQAVPDNMCSHQ